MVTLEATRI